MNHPILKVLVGSRAHGLHTDSSDYDYRGVFLEDTNELLRVFPNVKETNWVEGKEDNTSWEIGHFLRMAVKCNPTILEVFKAPVEFRTDYGDELRGIFHHVWNKNDVLNAFIGYGLNQRKKFLEKKDSRPHKYAVAYLRTLLQAQDLLSTGDFSVDMTGSREFDRLRRWKNEDFTFGEVIEVCHQEEATLRRIAETSPEKETNMEKIDEFLINIRKDHFYYRTNA